MKWSSFLEYVTMRAMGQEDTIARNYDLQYQPSFPGTKTTYAYSAMESMGLYRRNELPLAVVLGEVQAMLRSCGYVENNLNVVETLMCEWHIWHGLKYGSLRRWKYRRPENPLI